jgi:hypothetical protein
MGGIIALAGAMILGPRIGKFGPGGKINAIPGHNITAATIGCFVLGFALAAIQIIPLYELVSLNFREGSASYADVAGWALPSRQVATFLMPDFFGNPTHHSYFDIFEGVWKAAPQGTIFWGIKNYVEAGAYVGILALVLAAMGIVWAIRRRQVLHLHPGRQHAHVSGPAGDRALGLQPLALRRDDIFDSNADRPSGRAAN